MNQYIGKTKRIELYSNRLFSLQIPADEPVENFRGFVEVLDHITMLFQENIPQLKAKELIIENVPDSSCPICFRQMKKIILSTEPLLWSQIAYQYAHELCHYSLPHDVVGNLRWLEESICEMASLFYLEKIALLWQSIGSLNPNSIEASYAMSFHHYAQNTSANYEEVDLKDPAVLHFLETEYYDRKKNRYIANKLLPIFYDHPKTWLAVPCLCDTTAANIKDALDEVFLQSPEESHPGLLLIKNLF